MVNAQTGAVVRQGLPEAPSNLVLIEAFPIFRPKRFELWGRHAWDYRHYFLEPRKVVGLENIFRLGSPGGSSLQKRYEKAVAKGADEAKMFLLSVGLKEAPQPWAMFTDMIFDCTTKYEPEDRYLSWNETAMIAGVKGETFARLARTLASCTVYAAKFFRRLGFTLWDIVGGRGGRRRGGGGGHHRPGQHPHHRRDRTRRQAGLHPLQQAVDPRLLPRPARRVVRRDQRREEEGGDRRPGPGVHGHLP
ncbi:MAG: hypothetical protein MZU79_02885 [Anaerotruncus sp.]|nr:hypothetical protein [Anaerotruncus sp.]